MTQFAQTEKSEVLSQQSKVAIDAPKQQEKSFVGKLSIPIQRGGMFSPFT